MRSSCTPARPWWRIHLLSPWGQAAPDRQGGPARDPSTARPSPSPLKSRGERARCRPATSATRTSTTPTTPRPRPLFAACSRSRSSGRSSRASSSSSARRSPGRRRLFWRPRSSGQTGLPAVVTLAIHREPLTREGWTPEDACRRLEEAGAHVVGLNCIRGPRTMLPYLKPIRAAVSGPSPHSRCPTVRMTPSPAFSP
jgi:hypothetical protein